VSQIEHASAHPVVPDWIFAEIASINP